MNSYFMFIGRAAMERQCSRTSDEHTSISDFGTSQLPTQYRIRRKGRPTLLVQVSHNFISITA